MVLSFSPRPLDPLSTDPSTTHHLFSHLSTPWEYSQPVQLSLRPPHLAAMTGLLIFTGANSSMGIPAVDYILRKYPQYTAIFTVRDGSESDPNTKKLRETISRHPEANASVLTLDLASLSATHAFADTVISGIQSGKYPRVAAIVCNAYYWNLVGDPEPTVDGYDKTFQVGHISHAALVLRLVGHFGPAGRIVLLSSDSHWPGKNGMEKYPPSIPGDLELLVKPFMDNDKQGRGYQRYATTKLSITTWMYALNDHLEKVRTKRTIPKLTF